MGYFKIIDPPKNHRSYVSGMEGMIRVNVFHKLSLGKGYISTMNLKLAEASNGAGTD